LRQEGDKVADDEPVNPRAYPDRPFVGVGVVVFRGSEVLLAQRGKHPRRTTWSIPGGAQELGETVHEAGRREIMEETGLEIEILGLVDVVDSINRDEEGNVAFHYTLVDLFAEWRGGEAVAGDDCAAVRWVALENLADYDLRPATHDVILRAEEMRRRILAGKDRIRAPSRLF
jgi:ADP-ribose pyrophosphatase YjhB (NUDIX family)